MLTKLLCLVDVSIFYIFSAWGGGGVRGEDGAEVGFSIETPRGGSPMTGGGEGPGGCLREMWGGGSQFFFRGAEIPTKCYV